MCTWYLDAAYLAHTKYVPGIYMLRTWYIPMCTWHVDVNYLVHTKKLTGT